MTGTQEPGIHEPEWLAAIPRHERDLYAKAGLGNSSSLGASPALLIIDAQYRTLGRTRAPIEDAIKEYPTACGEVGWAAVDRLIPVVEQCRAQEIPVIFALVAPKDATRPGQQAQKVPGLLEIDSRGYDIVEALTPQPGDVLVYKEHSSAFFGTALVSTLNQLRVDTLLLAGCSTSGCVRATAVDAASFNLSVGVLAECVYDRSKTSHLVSLFDVSMKYGEVLDSGATTKYLKATEGERDDR